jgi:hypothetical protein
MSYNLTPKYKISLQKLRNIVSRILRNAGSSTQIAFETELRRAVRHIQIIKNTAPPGGEGDLAMVEAYKLYDRIQRLSDYPQFFSDSTQYKPNRVVSDRSSLYTHAARPASIRWDAAAMMAVPMSGEDRNWWRPPPRPAPVKHFTQEELENEYPAFTVRKERKDAT